MTHFLDDLPLDFRSPGVKDVLSMLTGVYYSERLVTPLLQDSGIPLGEVNLNQAMADAWPAILQLARGKNLLRPLLAAAAVRTPALADRIEEMLADAPVLPAPAPADGVEWKVDAADAARLERQIEPEATLLDVSFLARGLQLAPSVARLLVTMDGGDFYGTAFRIGEDLLLTNHHVLFDEQGAAATAVVAWFGFERSFAGAELVPQVVQCRPETIIGAADHDWAVVRTATPMPVQAEIIPLTGAPVPEQGDRVYIIQHPNGGVKKIGMIHNVVIDVTDDVVQYLTDTEGGSSGSPVFDERWRVVALHHQWDSKRVDGVIEYFNQGRRIDKVAAALSQAGVM